MKSIVLKDKCPFKADDVVVYVPTSRGRGLLVMTDLAELQPGEKYKISEVYEEYYLVLKGFEKAIPSAIFWSEFKAAEIDETPEDQNNID